MSCAVNDWEMALLHPKLVKMVLARKDDDLAKTTGVHVRGYRADLSQPEA